jgi:hypothetical protein
MKSVRTENIPYSYLFWFIHNACFNGFAHDNSANIEILTRTIHLKSQRIG